MEKTTSSEQETANLATGIAADMEPPRLVCLHGDLGAGKSTFARGFIKSLTSQKTEVPSPTFTLVQTYDTAKGPLYHFDLYRLEDPEEIYELDWDNALASALVLVEWPERLGSLLPARRTDVTLSIVDPTTRKITVHEHE